MTRVKILALLVGMILLFTLPAVVSAQVQFPHIFVGTVTLDGAPAPDGTVVSAWVEGVTDAAGTTTTSGGSYNIVADPGEDSWAGLTVTFLVAGSAAGESATFEHGGADVLDLTATSGAVRGRSIVLDLLEQHDSGQSGTATLTEINGNTHVLLSLSAGTLQSGIVHIHTGQCGDDLLGGVVHVLTDFVGGSGASNTTVVATLASLEDGDHAINAHELDNAGIYTACTNIPIPATAPAAVVDIAQVVSDLKSDASFLRAVKGPDGADGDDGQDGADGNDGPTGFTGDNGRRGSDGANGSAGARGPGGATGADGARGAAGSDGTDGASGSAGAAGEDGSGGALGIVALILAIIALVGAGGAYLLARRS